MAEWRKVDDLFQAAVELPPAERQPFLDVACAGDAELRRQVDAVTRKAGR